MSERSIADKLAPEYREQSERKELKRLIEKYGLPSALAASREPSPPERKVLTDDEWQRLPQWVRDFDVLWRVSSSLAVADVLDALEHAALRAVISDELAASREGPTPEPVDPEDRDRGTEFPRLLGRCPACGNTTLFRGSKGYITCSWLKCPNPGAAHELLSETAAHD